MDTAQLLAVAGALGWASGLRLYAVVFLTGAAGFLGWVQLPSGLALLQHPVVLGGSLLMAGAEFFADKIPGVDTLWDGVHTLVRIPAGAALAASLIGGVGGLGGFGDAGGQTQAALTLLAGLVGGTLAATAHTAKAATRAAANTSPEPFSNIGLSLAGDVAVPVMLWLAWEHPTVFLPVLAVLVVLSLVVIVLLFRVLRGLVRRFLPGRPPRRVEG